jgi:hypothetical protein
MITWTHFTSSGPTRPVTIGEFATMERKLWAVDRRRISGPVQTSPSRPKLFIRWSNFVELNLTQQNILIYFRNKYQVAWMRITSCLILCTCFVKSLSYTSISELLVFWLTRLQQPQLKLISPIVSSSHCSTTDEEGVVKGTDRWLYE